MQKISPFLWFDGKAEEAAKFYVSLLPNSRLGEVSRYAEGCPGLAGSVMSVNFRLAGQQFIAFNGGPELVFSSAISFFVNCKDQREVNRLWSRLSKGGEPLQCGWIKDRFGLTWQIIPEELPELLGDPDPEKAQRVMQAMLKMKKIDLAVLRKARAPAKRSARRPARKK